MRRMRSAMGCLVLAGALAGGLAGCGSDSDGGGTSPFGDIGGAQDGEGSAGDEAAGGQLGTAPATVVQGATLDQITANEGVGDVLGDLEEGETVQVFCRLSNHYAILLFADTEEGVRYWTNDGDEPLGHVYRTDLEVHGEVPVCSGDDDGNIHGKHAHAAH